MPYFAICPYKYPKSIHLAVYPSIHTSIFSACSTSVFSGSRQTRGIQIPQTTLFSFLRSQGNHRPDAIPFILSWHYSGKCLDKFRDESSRRHPDKISVPFGTPANSYNSSPLDFRASRLWGQPHTQEPRLSWFYLLSQPFSRTGVQINCWNESSAFWLGGSSTTGSAAVLAVQLTCTKSADPPSAPSPHYLWTAPQR